jgi:hypothetical protein
MASKKPKPKPKPKPRSPPSNDGDINPSSDVAAAPDAAETIPKRILPRHLARSVQPGVEYTQWGDLMWELYGLEVGTLSNGPLPDSDRVLQNWLEWQKKFAEVTIPLYPLPNGSGHLRTKRGLKNYRLLRTRTFQCISPISKQQSHIIKDSMGICSANQPL